MSDSTKVLRGEGSQEQGRRRQWERRLQCSLAGQLWHQRTGAAVLKALPAGQKLLAKPLPCCPFLTLSFTSPGIWSYCPYCPRPPPKKLLTSEVIWGT